MIRLTARFDSSTDAVQAILKTTIDWSESKQVKLAFAYGFLFAQPTVPDEHKEAVRVLMASIFADLDDVFIHKSFDDEDPRAFLDAMVQDIPDTSDADRQVLEGSVPFGMLATIHNRTFAEALSARTTALFASDPLRFEAEVGAAQRARGQVVVLDETAVFTLGYFGAAEANLLSGYPGILRVPLRQRLDAVKGAESLLPRSVMTVGRSADGTAVVNEISEDEAAARHQRAQGAVARYETLQAVEYSLF